MQVVWGDGNGVMRWGLRPAELSDLKSSKQTMKLNIFAHDAREKEPGAQLPQKMGHVMLDVRELSLGVRDKAYKVNGMVGASLVLSAKINATLPSADSPTSHEEADVVQVAEEEEEELDYSEEVFDEETDAQQQRPPKEVHFDADAPQQPEQQPEQEEEEEDLESQRRRHFRVTIDVRSIGGLVRPAHVGVTFVYPYLGATNAVRTSPVWVMANSEHRLDGASATYECCMSRRELLEAFTAHPLKITFLSRSNLGSAPLGDALLDLAGAMQTEPHSYRCPLTSKPFKTLQEYTKHRQNMQVLRAAGRFERSPPVDPVSVKAVDSYLSVTPVDAASADALSNCKARVVAIIEDIGLVGPEVALGVKPGYKMHSGAVYDLEGIAGSQDFVPRRSSEAYEPRDPLDREDLSASQRAQAEALRADWEGWRRSAEALWREALRDREVQLRRRLEADAAASLAERADDLRRAHEEAGRLEVRLRSAIDNVERQKSQWTIKEEQTHMKLAQKTSELQLLQRRVREEAKVKIDAESLRADSLQAQVKTLQEALERSEKRLKDTERDFDAYRTHARSTPESAMREEGARLRASLGESRAEVERERRCRTESELEKEHFRAQMHRLALALKREREKNSVFARQELEQLRLEFLAREERYVLDGDREELRHIRSELATLRSHTVGGAPTSPVVAPQSSLPSSSGASAAPGGGGSAVLRSRLDELMRSGQYDESDAVIGEIKREIRNAEGAAAIKVVVGL